MRMNIHDVLFERSSEAPPPYRAGVRHFDVDARMTHGVAFELEPGQAVCPYHYEYGHELWTVILEGRPSLRTPEGVQELDVGDILFVPRGPEGAHQLFNGSERRVRLLGFSNAGIGATAYPDSGKVGVWTDVPGEDFVAERSSAVGYFHHETTLTVTTSTEE